MNSTIGTIKELKDPQSVPQAAQVNQMNQAQLQAQQMQGHPNLQPSFQSMLQPDFGDEVQTLPVDANPISENDKKILSTFFSSPQSSKVIAEFKDALLGVLIFAVLSLPETDKIISNLVTYKSPYIIILIKSCVFAIIFYLAKNISISKKTK